MIKKLTFFGGPFDGTVVTFPASHAPSWIVKDTGGIGLPEQRTIAGFEVPRSECSERLVLYTLASVVDGAATYRFDGWKTKHENPADQASLA